METEASGSSCHDGNFTLEGEERREVIELSFSHSVDSRVISCKSQREEVAGYQKTKTQLMWRELKPNRNKGPFN